MNRVISTLNMSHEEWLEKRHESIGASETAAVLGLNRWQSKIDIYLQKTTKHTGTEDNLNMWLGREMEPLIKSLFEKETGKKVHNDYKIRIDPEYPFLTTNLDGMVVGEKVPVEYKTTSRWTGEIPDFYFCQLQHQMMITGAPYIYYAVLTLGDWKQFVVEKYERDDAFIAKMRAELVDFWQNNVVPEIEPEPSSEDDAKKLYRYAYSEATVVIDDNLTEKVTQLREKIDKKKELEGEIEAVRGDIMIAMRENEAITHTDGTPIVTWKNTRDGTSFDVKALKSERPEIYDKYLKPKKGYRRFILRKGVI